MYLQHLVGEHTLLGHLFILRSRLSVVGVRVDADAAAWGKESDDLDVLWFHQLHQVFHDDVDAVLMEIAIVAEGEEIELQALRLYHPLGGYVHNLDFSKVWLTRDRAE